MTNSLEVKRLRYVWTEEKSDFVFFQAIKEKKIKKINHS